MPVGAGEGLAGGWGGFRGFVLEFGSCCCSQAVYRISDVPVNQDIRKKNWCRPGFMHLESSVENWGPEVSVELCRICLTFSSNQIGLQSQSTNIQSILKSWELPLFARLIPPLKKLLFSLLLPFYQVSPGTVGLLWSLGLCSGGVTAGWLLQKRPGNAGTDPRQQRTAESSLWHLS